jgi:hypothetical protein
MKNATLKLTLMIAVVALMATPAFAAPYVLASSGSSSGNITLSGGLGASVTVNFTLIASNQLQVTVTNNSPEGSKLLSLGFSTTPNITGATITSPTITGWDVCSGGQCGLAGLVEIAFGGTGSQGLAAGDTGTITFTFDQDAPITIDSAYAHVGGLEGGASLKITETPEPASLVLLGTGLLSAGGFIRRKFAR